MVWKTSQYESHVLQARRQIEEELAQCRSTMIRLSRRLNELSIVTSFPVEIIGEILLQCALIYEADSETYRGPVSLYGYKCPYGWIKITHVCHYWRTVALNFPRLWSRIYLTRQICLEEIFRRSKDAPLSVFADAAHMGRDKEGRRAFARIMQELPRISSLRLCFPDNSPHIPALQKMTLPPASLLQSMVIVQGEAYSSKTRSALPLQDIECPKLRALEVDITHFQVNRSSILRPYLQRLVLVEPRVTRKSSTFSMDALSILKQLPLLEHVNLGHTVVQSAPSWTDMPASDDIVTLSRLRYLRLEGAASSCATLLYHVLFPTATRLVMDCTVSDGALDPECIMSAIASKLNSQSSTGSETSNPLVGLALCQGDGELEIVLRGWTGRNRSLEDSPNEELLLQSNPPPHVEISLRMVFPGDVLNRVSKCIRAFRILPLSDVASLRVDSDSPILKSDWLAAFSQMTALRALRVTGSSAKYLPEILSARKLLPCRKGIKYTTYVFRSVRSLTLEQVRLNPLPVGDWDTDSFLLDNLLVCLRARKKQGAGLKRVTLDRCSCVVRAEVKRLERVVGKLEWDGIEHPPDESDGMYTDNSDDYSNDE